MGITPQRQAATGLHRLTAIETAKRLESGAATSEALVGDCLDRIARRDAEVRAWTHLDRDHAFAQARARDREPRRSMLHGIPVGIKDIFDTCDMPTTYGSPIYSGHRPDNDSVVVALARRAGMVVLGKCATTEFASPVPAGVRNPHDLSRTPGVSSSGSAAAVADHMVPLAIGSQTGGSTILPASYCGVVGYKASLTGLDRGNIRHLRPTLDTIGLFARCVADIVALRAVLTGGSATLPALPIKGLRIGVCRTGSWSEARPETVTTLENSAARLAQAGGVVGDVELPSIFDTVAETFGVISTTEASRALAAEARDHRARLNGWIQDSLAAAARHGPSRYEEAQRHAVACQRALGELFEQSDILITPSTPGEAPADLVSISSSVFNRIWTLMHVPCVSLPVGRGPSGMPVGLQIVGPLGSDVRTLAAAQSIAELLV